MFSILLSSPVLLLILLLISPTTVTSFVATSKPTSQQRINNNNNNVHHNDHYQSYDRNDVILHAFSLGQHQSHDNSIANRFFDQLRNKHSVNSIGNHYEKMMKNNNQHTKNKNNINIHQMIQYGLLDTMDAIDFTTTSSSSSSSLWKNHHNHQRLLLVQLTQTASHFIRTFSQMTIMAFETARKNTMLLFTSHVAHQEEEKTINRMVVLLYAMMVHDDDNNNQYYYEASTRTNGGGGGSTTYVPTRRSRSPYNNNTNNDDNHHDDEHNEVEVESEVDVVVDSINDNPPANLRSRRQIVSSSSTATITKTKNPKVNNVLIPVTSSPQTNKKSGSINNNDHDYDDWNENDHHIADDGNDDDEDNIPSSLKSDINKKKITLTNKSKKTTIQEKAVLAKEVLKLAEEQAKKSVERKYEKRTTLQKKMKQKELDNGDGSLYVEEQIEQKRLLNEAKKRLREEKTKAKATTTTSKKNTVAKATTKGTSTKTKVISIPKKSTSTAIKKKIVTTTTIISDEENVYAEQQRLQLLKQKDIGIIENDVDNDKESINDSNNNINIYEKDDATLQLEFLAKAARDAVEEFERKQQQQQTTTYDENKVVEKIELLMSTNNREQIPTLLNNNNEDTFITTNRNGRILTNKNMYSNVPKTTTSLIEPSLLLSSKKVTADVKGEKVLLATNNDDSTASSTKTTTATDTSSSINFDKITDIARMAREAVDRYTSQNTKQQDDTNHKNNIVATQAKEMLVAPSKRDWSRLTVNELRRELNQRSLSTTGTKLKLIKLLEQSDHNIYIQQQQIIKNDQKDAVVDENNNNKNSQKNLLFDDDTLYSWQDDIGLSDDMMNNLERLAKAARNAVDQYEQKEGGRGVNLHNMKNGVKEEKVVQVKSNKDTILLSKKNDNTKQSVVVVPSLLPDYVSMTVSVLKIELKTRGLPISGLKAELIHRLVQHDNVVNHINKVNRAGATTTTTVLEKEKVVSDTTTTTTRTIPPKPSTPSFMSTTKDSIFGTWFNTDKENNNHRVNVNMKDSLPIDNNGDDDDDDMMFLQLNDNDKQALAVIDELLLDFDDLDEPTDDILFAIENEMNSYSSSSTNSRNDTNKKQKISGFSFMNDPDMSSSSSMLSSESIEYSPFLNKIGKSSSTITATGMMMMDYENMGVNQLKNELKLRNLRLIGKKVDLIQRLKAHDQLILLRSPVSSSSMSSIYE